MALFSHIGWFFKAHWRTYLLAMLMLTGVALMNMAIPYLIGQTIDQMLATRHGGWHPGGYLVTLLGLGVGVYLLRVGWRRLLFGTSYQLGNRLRERYYQCLTRQGPVFYQRHNSGDLMARATNDIDAIELAAGEGVLSGFDGLLTFVLVLVMMFAVIDWRLALVALLPFPPMGWSFHHISRAVHQHFQRSLEQFSRLNDKTQEALAGIRLIKAMGREEAESRAFAAIAEDAADSNYQVSRSEALYEPVIFLCMAAAVLLTLGYGAWLIWQEQLSIGQLTSFTMYLGQLIWPMFAFGWLLNIVERGSAAFERVDALLAIADSIADHGQRLPENAELSVRGLCFSYPDTSSPVLEQIDFELPRGKMLGVVGPTGAGKSTLIQLLMRHWESPDRQILISGRPLAYYRLDALRAMFSYVPQDAFLFSTSIAENIALARPDASQQAIEHAARLAAVHHDITLFPQGYRTQVGERGVTLSGGQRQRLAIARAWLTGAPILILDDALSAVDLHTERQILRHLQQRSSDQSCILISHRLSAVEQADEILVLAHGRVLERGDHRQLMAHDGWYARMWTYQQMEAEDAH